MSVRIVHTRNSAYEVREANGEYSVKKVTDLYPGGHPNVQVGDAFHGTFLFLELGYGMILEGGRKPLHTSKVLSIEERL